MILIIKEKHTAEYRLQSYEDFYRKLPEHCDCYFYGLDSPNYDPDKTIYDIIAECPEYPEDIFVMAPLFKFIYWDNVKAKKYLLITDSVCDMEKLQKAKHYPGMDRIEWDGVFHHYLHCLDFMKSAIHSKRWIYWPNWAADCYDYEANEIEKDIDFFMSGKYSHEYEMRKRFHKAFHKSGLNFVDNFQEKRINTKEDNAKFRDLLMRSKYSPHDGGINGRMVPRYVESCYAKSVIISPNLGEEMGRMGFEYMENCIIFSRSIDKRQVKNVIGNTAILGKILFGETLKYLSKNAYKLIKERHTTDCRIKEFLEVVNDCKEN